MQSTKETTIVEDPKAATLAIHQDPLSFKQDFMGLVITPKVIHIRKQPMEKEK